MIRTDLINRLAAKIRAKSYLEIGVRHRSENFNLINIEKKVCVDPGSEGVLEADLEMTSDFFFEHNKEFFDIIFIDGLHESKQVERDIINSLKFLNPDGYIICHDMNPEIREHQLPCNSVERLEYTTRERQKGNPRHGIWTGDCWRAWVKIRSKNKHLKMFVVNTDFGCGVITRGKQELIDLPKGNINFRDFNENRVEWLNLMNVDSFNNMMRANVISYFNKIEGNEFSKDSQKIIKIWRKSWSKNGWNPIILNESWARKNPLYFKLKEVLKHRYPLSCYMRLLAYCQYVRINGPTLYSDYDVINYSFNPNVLNFITGDSFFNPERAVVYLCENGVDLIEEAIGDFIKRAQSEGYVFHSKNDSDLIVINPYVETTQVFRPVNYNLKNHERRSTNVTYYSTNMYHSLFKTNPEEAESYQLVHYDGGLYKRALDNGMEKEILSDAKDEEYWKAINDSSQEKSSLKWMTRSQVIEKHYNKKMVEVAGVEPAS